MTKFKTLLLFTFLSVVAFGQAADSSQALATKEQSEPGVVFWLSLILVAVVPWVVYFKFFKPMNKGGDKK